MEVFKINITFYNKTLHVLKAYYLIMDSFPKNSNEMITKCANFC